MSNEKQSIGFAVRYKHVSGNMKISIVSKTPLLAKANYLNSYFVNIDRHWTSAKVENAWNSWKKLHEASVVEVFTEIVDS